MHQAPLAILAETYLKLKLKLEFAELNNLSSV
jgi:hypothetical protein